MDHDWLYVKSGEKEREGRERDWLMKKRERNEERRKRRGEKRSEEGYIKKRAVENSNGQIELIE